MTYARAFLTLGRLQRNLLRSKEGRKRPKARVVPKVRLPADTQCRLLAHFASQQRPDLAHS